MKQNKANVRAVPTLQKHTSKLGNNIGMLRDYTWMLLHGFRNEVFKQ